MMGFMLDSAKLGDLNSNVSIMGSGMVPGSATIRYRLSNNKAQVLSFSPSVTGDRAVDCQVIHESTLLSDASKSGTTADILELDAGRS